MSIKEIQERHDAVDYKHIFEFEKTALEDRGELLDALKYESAKCPWCGVKHERGMNTLCPFTKAEAALSEQTEFIDRYLAQPDQTKVWDTINGWEAALREAEKQMKRANDMINNSYQCECGEPTTPCPCLEGFLDNLQAILAGVRCEDF